MFRDLFLLLNINKIYKLIIILISNKNNNLIVILLFLITNYFWPAKVTNTIKSDNN